MDQEEITRWKQAVVHLECVTGSESHWDSTAEQERLLQSLFRGELTREEMIAQQNAVADRSATMKTRDVRSRGTAVYLAKGARRYLLTARHVLHDASSAEKKRAYLTTLREGLPGDLGGGAADAEDVDRTIYDTVFRVRSFDEMLAGARSPKPLLTLGAGLSSRHPYTFSDPSDDLAVLSLDSGYSDFADELDARGYVPVELSDVLGAATYEGQEVYAIGYPQSVAPVGTLPLSSGEAQWASEAYSLPVVSFGRVAMLHRKLRSFWADLSIYPGNSGGPIISEGKLVGIVSAQAVVPLDGDAATGSRGRVRIPFAVGINAGLIAPLIEAQEVKDRRGV